MTKKVHNCIRQDSTIPTTCQLYKTCLNPFMPSSGNINSELLLIGEGPGEEEDKNNLQFIGDSGKLLRHALEKAGITNFRLDNAVRCRPPHNRDPLTSEIHTCKPFIYENIAAMKNLRLIVLVGNYAMMSLLGHKGVLDSSGTIRDLVIGDKTYAVMCLMHPSYVLQNQSELNKFLNHASRIPVALTGKLVDPSDKGKYITIKDIAGWDALVDKIYKAKYLNYDLETNALDPYFKDTTITVLGISIVPREAYVMDWELYGAMILPKLKKIMQDPDIKKAGQNIKFDNLWLEVKYGIDVRGTVWSTDIGQYLLDENESHGLKSMAWKYTRLGGYEQDLVKGEPHLSSGANLLEYCAIDADISNRIYHIQKPMIEAQPDLARLNTQLLLPVCEVLKRMEIRGIRIDPIRLNDCKIRVDTQLDSLRNSLMTSKSVKAFEKAHPNKKFNPRSGDMLREVLFDIEKLKPVRQTAKSKKASTDRATLEVYKDKSTVCKLMVDHSLYSSMKSKMIKELETYTVGGRIHTHYWVTETSTGRSSSDDPNLQNVTKGDKDVVGIRKVFMADEGFKLVEFDYNQHELRCMAELAEDAALYEACESGDVHAATAGSILKKDPKQVTSDERRDIGKTFNFGFIYGLTKYGIIKRLRCTDHVAQNYLDRFFEVYNKTKLYMDATTWFVKNHGYVKSRTGRLRRFPIWNELDDTSIREAINMPVQSLAGDILLYSLIKIDKFLRDVKAKSYLCLEIHDSLILNVHESEMDLLPKIKNIMLNDFREFIPFKYNLAVDGKIGPDWGSMEKLNV